MQGQTTDATDPTQAPPMRIPLRGMYDTITGYVLVDAADYEWLNQYRWHKVESRTNAYARRWERLPDRREKYTWMHRQIAAPENAGRVVEIDHENSDGLDNRRENLIVSSRKANAQTRRKMAPASSKYRGVCWVKSINRWRATVKVDGKRIYLGQFTSEDDANAAAIAGRRKYLEHSRN